MCIRDREIIGEEPKAFPALGSYVSVKKVGNLIFTAGQIPVEDGKPIALGKVGKEVTIEKAQECAQLAAFNSLGALKTVLNDLSKVDEVVKVTVFVNSAAGFTNQPAVANGASDFYVKVFGEKGKHARSAVGVAELPLNVPVEVEAIISVKE
eukprot:TRINITY_DN11938_c0_g1_i2.p1 TRINITY_DN11938_c0_g1~~TRINITY_DN11938_c0_g1_i2.p1  ORF type:complete len:152 (-),score=53.17 TRINITY_DN11938_c0_g1_i2:133-588(-)